MTIRDAPFYHPALGDLQKLKDARARRKGPGADGELAPATFDRGERKRALKEMAARYREHGIKFQANPYREPLRALMAEAVRVGGWSSIDVSRQTGIARASVPTWIAKI